jgi:hypothetical protein
MGVLFCFCCCVNKQQEGGSSAVSVPSLVILKHVNERITIDKSETERDSQKSIDRQRERTDIQETAVIAGLARLHHAQLVAVRSSNTKHKVRRDKRREEAKNKADEGGWGSDVDVVVLANGAEAVVTCSSVRVCVCVCTMTMTHRISFVCCDRVHGCVCVCVCVWFDLSDESNERWRCLFLLLFELTEEPDV